MPTNRVRHRRSADPNTPFGQLEPGEIALNTANRQIAVGDAAVASPGVPTPMLAVRIFDSRGIYAIGDYVVHSGQLMRCISGHAMAVFDPANFQAIITAPLIDDKLALYLPLAGGTLTGALQLPIAPPADDTSATNKKYVDTLVQASIVAGVSAIFVANTPAGGIQAVNVQDALNELDTEKAPLDSPALEGEPTAPLPDADDSSDRIATTAFVAGQASEEPPLMDSAAAYGISLRYAREDHVHPIDTSRAPLTSPAFDGTPTAPTAPAGTNTLQLATTAFVLGNAPSAIADGIVTYAKIAPAAIATRAEFLANTPNKLLNVTTAWAAGTTVVMADGATVSPDLLLGIDFIWTIAASGRTIATPQSISAKVGQKGMIYIVQGAGGSKLITNWSAVYKFPAGTKPILSTAAGAIDCLSYAIKSASEVHCFFARGMA